MHRYTNVVFTLVVAFVLFATIGSVALAQCRPDQRGTTAACPAYTAPATTAVPNASMGGSLVVGPGATPLFNGAVPPNGFMVQINSQGELGNLCYVNDNGPATANPPTGFLIGGWNSANLPTSPSIFVTPPGYKPIGPVSVWCPGSLYIEARGW
jgi:hypothetical protein